MAAALLAFSLSIDDFVITNFVSGTTNTFPIWVYSIQRNALPVQINVIGSIIFLGAVGLVLIVADARSRSRAARRQPAAARPKELRDGRHRPGPDRRRVTSPLPDRSVVPPVWGRITNLVVDRGEGSWLVTPDGERYLDYTLGIGVTNTGHAHPRVVAAIQAQAAKLLHGQQNIVYHEPGLRLYERLADLLPGGAWRRSSRTAARRRSRRRSSSPGSRPAGRRSSRSATASTAGPAQAMALTDGQGRLPRRVRAAAGVRLPRGLPVLLPGAGGSHDPAELHLRLGGPARPAVPPARLPRAGRGDHRGAGHRRGRLPRAAAGVPAAAPGDHPRSTGSCSSPTRSRPASAGPASCSRCSHWDVEPDILVMAKGIASGLPLSGILAKRRS